MLNYKQHNSGQDLILFLHGFMYSDIWDRSDFTKYFDTYTCILIDILGFGSSIKPDIDYTLDEHLNILIVTIEDILKRYNPINTYIIGYSTGSILLLHLLAKNIFPIKKAVCISTPFIIKNNVSANIKIFDKISKAKGFNDFFNAAKIAVELMPDLNKFNMHFLENQYLDEFKKNKPNAVKNTFQNVLLNSNVIDIIKNISIDILIIHPKHDNIVALKDVKQLCDKHDNLILYTWKNDHYITKTNCCQLVDKIKLFFNWI